MKVTTKVTLVDDGSADAQTLAMMNRILATLRADRPADQTSEDFNPAQIPDVSVAESKILSLFTANIPVTNTSIATALNAADATRAHVHLFSLRVKLRVHGFDIHHDAGVYKLVSLK